jgi:hypothetical protein
VAHYDKDSYISGYQDAAIDCDEAIRALIEPKTHCVLNAAYKAMLSCAPQPPDDRVRELEKDAERYRWILHNAEATDALWMYAIPNKITLTENHISNAIDQAMKEANQ